jgi:polyhydroxyalkanoate synthesis regulator protein
MKPITIKKYANRRLYNTGTSTYVTLEDLAAMVKNGEDFLVYDAKTGDDITRSVLAQIIFEQENKAGPEPAADHIPAPADPLLRRQHADAGAALSRTVHRHADARAGKVPQQMTTPSATRRSRRWKNTVRRNMEMFERTFSMFKPFVPTSKSSPPTAPAGPKTDDAKSSDDIDTLRRQMKEMQDKLESLSKEPEKKD